MAPVVIETKLESQSITDFGADPATTLKQVEEQHHPVVLTRQGRDVAVVVDVESYQRLIDELALLRDVHRGLRDVEAGRVVAHEEVAALLKERYPA